MSLAELAIEKRAVSYFCVVLLLVGGIVSFFSLGQLEDPEFSVKSAGVTTYYPGASPSEVELEVTDRLEQAIQELPQIDDIYSTSRAGVSTIAIDLKQEYWSDRLPQVWDELRKKISDTRPNMPPGVGEPIVGDDFGFVYGFVLAVTGDGFTYSELEDYADHLKKELSVVQGVSRVELWGVQQKAVFIDAAEKQLSELGITPESIEQTLQRQNMVVDAGSIDIQDQRLRVSPTGEFTSPEDIAELQIRPSAMDEAAGSSGRTGELLRIGDLGEVSAGYVDPPVTRMRFNGQPAIGVSLANVSGGNVVDTGKAIDARLETLIAELPIGLEVTRVAWQSDEVAASVSAFLVNLLQAILIVLVVLTLPMGWRMGVIIGSGLILTILGTFMVMSIMGIDLQRMSLGALVIALGMMVDNSIVVADGFVVRLGQGMERKKAAIEAASIPSWPLLGATFVAVMAFYPIFASVANAGEYCRTLFSVVAISLLMSWLLSVTVTPLQCMDLIPDPEEGSEGDDPYGGKFYDVFRGVLSTAIQRRYMTVGLMVGLLFLSVVGFGSVKQMFFPDSMRAQFMIDFWMPEGTRIQDVSTELAKIEEKVRAEAGVKNISSFIGAGPPRFYLPVDPEGAKQSYAQLIVNTDSYKDVGPLTAALEKNVAKVTPEALVRVRKYGVGPADTWKAEARFSGPAEADFDTLRELGLQGMAILEASPLAKEVRTDMRQRVAKIVPDYDQEKARWASVQRDDIAAATRRAYDGIQVGLYREGDDLLPIILRSVEDERNAAADLSNLQITPNLSRENVPLEQVVSEIRTEWEDPIIVRYNRRRAVTVQASPANATFPSLYASVVDQFNAIELPPLYELMWDGEFKSTYDAQSSLTPGMVPAVVVMLFIIVALFNAYRPTIVILLTIPFVFIGITAGLLGTGSPFGFVALLGAMSLCGMMIKNAIVLLDEVDIQLAAGKSQYDAVTLAAVSRLRPVALASATTILGVIPLLKDLFWVSMAVVLMVGLTFGTILTMVLVPVFYSIVFKVPAPEGETSK